MSDLPNRDVLTTREICAWRRITPETLTRRRKSGAIDLSPCDRGRQMLFNRADVLRAFGQVDSARSPSTDDDPWM
ncbi:hypothetical protein [Brevundimonas sp.]|uniref:hypothetical protein n=1 Tax=Brevundimonas sp. TaxID=1871086 RepID=UPI0035B09EDA